MNSTLRVLVAVLGILAVVLAAGFVGNVLGDLLGESTGAMAAWIVIDVAAVVAVIWLIQAYRKRRRGS